MEEEDDQLRERRVASSQGGAHPPPREGGGFFPHTDALRDRGIEVVRWRLCEIIGGDGRAQGMTCIINRTSS